MKNIILKTIAVIMVLVLLLSMSAMDSVNRTIPVIGMFVSMAYLALFAYANQEEL